TISLAALFHHCLRCEHTWLRRVVTEPRMCPKCKSQYWNKARVRKLQPENEAAIRGKAEAQGGTGSGRRSLQPVGNRAGQKTGGTIVRRTSERRAEGQPSKGNR